MSHTATSETLVSPSQNAASPSSPASKGASIEQSVRLFRIFEALRNGDTAAISKAIREESSGPADARQSTASLSSIPPAKLEGTSILHLAVQCAELPVVEYVLSNVGQDTALDINGRDKDGNTPLHVAAQLGRAPIVRMLLDHPGVNDALTNFQGQTPLDAARTPDIFQQLQLARSIFIDTNVRKIQELVMSGDYEGLEKVLVDPRIKTTLDVNGGELAKDPATVESGGTLLHEAARKRDTKLIQLLLLNGADPFRRDRKGKLPQDVTKDDKTKAILKKSPAAAAAQRGIQERTILGGAVPQAAGPAAAENPLGSKEGREMKGYLKKWTNYTSGYKLRWFVLEDGVLSYYKHQDDAGSACRGAINMRIARLHMDPQDKLRFEIHGKSSVKYHLKANHQVEAKRWFWALNNAIQWSKDEAKEEERRQNRENEALRQAKMEQMSSGKEGDALSMTSSRHGKSEYIKSHSLLVPPSGSRTGPSTAEDDEFGNSAYDPSVAEESMNRLGRAGTFEADMDDEDYGDENSSHEAQPATKDAFNITAQSAKLQLDLLAQVATALQAEKAKNPAMKISDPAAVQVLSSYEAAVGNLKGLVGDLLRIAKDRDAYWQYRLDREANVRRMWEDSMAKVAREQEELETKIGESEDKRRKIKRALREAVETGGLQESNVLSKSQETSDNKGGDSFVEAVENVDTDANGSLTLPRRKSDVESTRTKATLAQLAEMSDSDDDDEDEFFDAVGAGEIEVVDRTVGSETLRESEKPSEEITDLRSAKSAEIVPSFKGYEDPVRTRLKMDADNRPKISLWGILKSMIGKDMTKMTLPVSFNEPTSLLQRVAEDMEYTDLLDTAAERTDSTERMVYVAAFAASEYASTIGRVAKPFNPLLGETYEYARPDKGYRFLVEQVSHHPPIGAAWAEAPKWDYYGESAVRSKFYGKSFDINPLGTWFLRLRPSTGGSELYTWKKVTSSVIGIITGNPTVDNYGLMEIKNHTTNETCILDFKPRGWKASSAYQVAGKVLDSAGKTRWSIGGRWNDKIYARLTPGYDASAEPSGKEDAQARLTTSSVANPNQAILVWECHARPTGIPFNLTPFVLTLNALPDRLKPVLAPTDTRLRPDQRAMEDGEYDFAATEKNRVEEKQREKRREREAKGESFEGRWFERARCEITGEEYWRFNGEYWRMRERVANGESGWEGCEDIF
ncbi:oxysterol-binding protein [Saccharata proteae CBS 121410]|uniref:Oxysterol-binding protein n=1 Tax=Saccharata proteae CBS 121410 TaxID=1314787 RepID=A0A9P4HR41_9PEZI|nr:oxysterol-binding protein [Saccharata proteae CBS 121410]